MEIEAAVGRVVASGVEAMAAEALVEAERAVVGMAVGMVGRAGRAPKSGTCKRTHRRVPRGRLLV